MEGRMVAGCCHPEWGRYVRQAGPVDREAWLMSRFVPVDRDTAYLLPPSVMKFRQFLLRGVNHVSGEWDLVCLAYNVKRMHRMQGT